MRTHWRIRLDDDHGRFWLSGERLWSDCIDDGTLFSVEAEARAMALQIRTSIAANREWFPKIKVVSFKGN
jgi:hypothetical protein